MAHTPYLYSTYEEEDEAPPSDRRKVIILGCGPNRIGQGIEFDYCCVHAAFALRELGVEAIMVNCNPETVSTDYDTSDRLYFEPLTLEDVLNIVEKEKPLGVIVQFGGQTPLKLAVPLQRGRRADPRHVARRHRPRRGPPALQRAPRTSWACSQAAGATVRSLRRGARRSRGGIGYPVLVRPSYVLGGRAMQIVYDDQDLVQFVGEAVEVAPDHPILDRQVPGGRARDRRGRRVATASAWWSAASWSTSRRPACTPATRPARCRPTRWTRAR